MDSINNKEVLKKNVIKYILKKTWKIKLVFCTSIFSMLIVLYYQQENFLLMNFHASIIIFYNFHFLLHAFV